MLRLRAWTARTSVIHRALRSAAKSVRRLTLAGLRLRWVWWVHSAHHAHRHALQTRHALELHQAKTVILSLEDQIDFQHATHRDQLMQIHDVHTAEMTHDEMMASHLNAVGAHLDSAKRDESAARTHTNARVESTKVIESALPMDLPPPPPRHHSISMHGEEAYPSSEHSGTFADAKPQFGSDARHSMHGEEAYQSSEHSGTFADVKPQFGSDAGDLPPPDFHDDDSGLSSTATETAFDDDAPPPF